MSAPIQPWTLLVVAIAGWIQREQQAAIVYLLEENKVLKARLRGRKLRLTDEERRRLAVKGKALGRKLLAEVAGIVTPETLLAWHRTRRQHLIAEAPAGQHQARRRQRGEDPRLRSRQGIRGRGVVGWRQRALTIADDIAADEQGPMGDSDRR